MKPFLLLFACTLSVASAQITLDRAEAELILNAKSGAFYDAQNVDGTTFDVGNMGGGNTYDLSGYTFTKDSADITSSDPASTPHASSFPTATHARAITIQGATVYLYYRLAIDGLYDLGTASESGGQQFIFVNDPEDPAIRFPTTFGTSWTYTGNPKEDIPGTTTQRSYSLSVDAYGTLVLPGKSLECLRMKQVTFNTSEYDIGGIVFSSVTKSVDYSFVTKNGVAATVSIDTLDENSSNPKVESIDYVVYESNPTPVEQVADRSFELGSVYPNPVNLSSEGLGRFSLTLPADAHINAEVYDLHGRKLHTVFDGRAESGTHRFEVNTRQMNNGNYVLRVIRDGQSSSRVFTVVK